MDEDVLMHSVEIIQLGVPGSKTNMEVVCKMNGLKEIAIQLKIYMELHLKGSTAKEIEEEKIEL